MLRMPDLRRLRVYHALAIALAVLPPRWAVAQPVPASALVHRALGSDTVIAGIPCARTERRRADFYRDGQLAGCLLSTDHQMGAHRFPRGTWVDVNPNGVLWAAWLARDTELAGHRCRGDGYKKWSVRFHPSGALQSCYLVHDTVVDGVPCMRGSFYRDIRSRGRVTLHLMPDGRLRSCTASRDTTLGGITFTAWQVVRR